MGQYVNEDRCFVMVDFSNRCPVLVDTTASTRGCPEIEHTEIDINSYKFQYL